jgi:Protein of unknown function (DUF3995)
MQPASTQPKHSATSKRRPPADGSAQAVDRDERRPLSVTGGVTARAKGLPRRLRAVLERGRRLVGGALRPGHRAALAAGVGCAAYGALKLYWALGGELLMRQAPLTADQRRHLLEGTGTLNVENWASVALAAIGIALAVATVRDRRLPRLLVVGLPTVIGALMLARAASGAASDIAVLTGAAHAETHTENWDLALWSPFFAAWGTAWGLAALAARRRTAGHPRRHAHRPPSPHRGGRP